MEVRLPTNLMPKVAACQIWTWSQYDQNLQSERRYDSDDSWFAESKRPQVALTGPTTGKDVSAQRIRVLAISDLEELSGKYRARSWIGKLKSGFPRDQAPDDEKCLFYGNLMVGWPGTGIAN